MRLALLILMIALLPLRGWVASAMAVAHEGHLDDLTLIAASASNVRAKANFYADIAQPDSACLHAATQRATATATAAEHDHNGQYNAATCACQACGLCHLSSAALHQPAAPEAMSRAVMPAQRTTGFTSVTTPPGLKPPIA